MRWTRQRRARGRDRRAGRKIRERSSSARDERRCCGRRSRVVLTPVAGVKSRGGFVGPTGRVKPSNSRGDGDKKELVAGEITKETVKTIAQGRPDDPPTPVVTTVCFLPLHTGHGCGGHPAFPAPSLFRGTRIRYQLGHIVPRARRCFYRRLKGAQYLQPTSLRGAKRRSNPGRRTRLWIAHMGNVCVKDEQSPFCSTGALRRPTTGSGGRSNTPRHPCSIRDGTAYWIPRMRGI